MPSLGVLALWGTLTTMLKVRKLSQRGPLRVVSLFGSYMSAAPRQKAKTKHHRLFAGTHAQCQHAATDPAELRAYVRKPSIVRISQRSSSSMVQNLEAPLEDGSQ
eukprot:scaffold202604_cov15-Tisochrysis_lutea.AAC.1